MSAADGAVHQRPDVTYNTSSAIQKATHACPVYTGAQSVRRRKVIRLIANELQRMRKETVLAQFKAQFRYLNARIEETHGAQAETGTRTY
jgi:hypothetical protein